MTDITQELRGLIAGATPTLLGVNPAAMAKLLRAGAEQQKPRARDFDDINFDIDGTLISRAINHLPALLDRLEEAEKCKERIAAMIDGSDGNIPFTTLFVPLIIGHNQPCMSGDMRDRLHPHQRRRFDDACKTLATAIQEVKP